MTHLICKMGSSLLNTLVQVPATSSPAILGSIMSRYYAAGISGKKSKLSSGGRIKEFPVEKDPYKLVNYCCGSNYFIEGEDVPIKPESEYPDWLWTIRTGPPPELHELDPNTKEYWCLVRKLERKRKNAMIVLRKHVLKRF